MPYLLQTQKTLLAKGMVASHLEGFLTRLTHWGVNIKSYQLVQFHELSSVLILFATSELTWCFCYELWHP